MKLTLILLLLITSLMAVVGAFLTTSVTSFYIDSFYRTLPNTPTPRTLMRNTGLELLQKVKSRSVSCRVRAPEAYSAAAVRAPMG